MCALYPGGILSNIYEKVYFRNQIKSTRILHKYCVLCASMFWIYFLRDFEKKKKLKKIQQFDLFNKQNFFFIVPIFTLFICCNTYKIRTFHLHR